MIRVSTRLAATLGGILLALTVFAFEASPAQAPANGTVVLTGGRVIDGTGRPPKRHRLRHRLRLVGYAPGMFAFMVYGAILDANPGAGGYHIVFIVLAALALVGALVSSGLVRAARARREAVEV